MPKLKNKIIHKINTLCKKLERYMEPSLKFSQNFPSKKKKKIVPNFQSMFIFGWLG